MKIKEIIAKFCILQTSEKLKFLQSLNLRGCYFSSVLKGIQNDPDFKEYEMSLNIEYFKNNRDYLRLLRECILGQNKYCKICGKPIINSHETCSRTCQAEYAKPIREATNLARYGVKNTFQSEEKKLKIQETNLARYGVRHAAQISGHFEKVQKTCMEKYGVPYAAMATNYRKLLSEKNQCKVFSPEGTHTFDNLENFNTKYVREHFVKDNFFEREKFMKYFGIQMPSTADKYKEKFGITEQIKRYQSIPQKELFDGIPVKNKIANDRTVIKPQEIDIVLPDFKLGIEYNGAYWHNDVTKESTYHLDKCNACEKAGYQLFSIFDFDDIEIWKSMISNKLGMNRKIYARKCIIKELKYGEINGFLIENHLQGGATSKYNIGLFYEDELVQVMTFSTPRFTKAAQYELVRLCTKKYTNVIGGSSKLFKYFVKKYKPQSIVSYANRRFSQGKIYELLGFKLDKISKPNYWYIRKDEIKSRVQCQKHKLSKILENFDENKSEDENMKANGYMRIYDCGNRVYIWKC